MFIIVGLLFIVSGFILNEWLLAALFSSDGLIVTAHKIVIWFVDLCLIGTGLIVIKLRRSLTKEIIFVITGAFIIIAGILFTEKFLPIALDTPMTGQNRTFFRAFEVYFIATGLFAIFYRRSIKFESILRFGISGLFCFALFSVYVYYRRGVLYNALIYFGSLLGINLIGTVPERLIIFVVIILILYQLSTRLALIKKKRLVSNVFAGIITLLIGIYLSNTILRNLPIMFASFLLILFLLSMRLPFTKRRKIVSTALAGLITISISANGLTDLHRVLLPDQAVTRFAKGNYNNLAIDMDQDALYAVGHGINHIHAYNINALNESPRLSKMETGHEAFFSYNAEAKEIYIYIRKTQQLDIVDAASLTTKQSIPIQFPPGLKEDTWIKWSQPTGYIIAAAESGNKVVDKATVVVSRKQGKVVKEIPLSPMNILVHPARPLLYMSFFQGISNEIIIYDLEALSISNQTIFNARMDRMAFLESVNELLVTIPTKSLIYRLDADTLALKGEIKSSFGVRTMAVDAKRNLLLTVSLVTNILDVIDLDTYQSIKRYYLAPWLRSIALDGSGNAYVSSFTSLFRVNYAQEG